MRKSNFQGVNFDVDATVTERQRQQRWRRHDLMCRLCGWSQRCSWIFKIDEHVLLFTWVAIFLLSSRLICAFGRDGRWLCRFAAHVRRAQSAADDLTSSCVGRPWVSQERARIRTNNRIWSESDWHLREKRMLSHWFYSCAHGRNRKRCNHFRVVLGCTADSALNSFERNCQNEYLSRHATNWWCRRRRRRRQHHIVGEWCNAAAFGTDRDHEINTRARTLAAPICAVVNVRDPNRWCNNIQMGAF